MSNSIVLQNVRIIDPSRDLDEVGAIVVEDGVIVASGKNAKNHGIPKARPFAIAMASSPFLASSTRVCMSANPAASIVKPSRPPAVRQQRAASPPSS